VHQQGQRLLIHGPPQFGKSIIISQRFPVYTLGINPSYRVRVACYNVSHAQRFSRVNLDLMRDPSYIGFFPAAGVGVPAVASIEEWSTAARSAKRDANPSFKPLGLGTGFTGLGVDTLVIDDPYKDRMEARSEATNAMLWGWWTDTVLPRLNPATNIVVMFHRWWEGDFAGQLLAQGGWELLRFPAIADGLPGDPTGRAIGEPLSPRYSLEYLAGIRQKQGTSFEALYQGTPYPAEGGMFKAGKVGWVDVVPAGAARVRRWDVAATDGAGDYSCGVLMARQGQRYYVEDMVYGQWGSAQRDGIIRETAERDARRGPVTTILPQDPGSAGKDMAFAFVRLLAGFAVEIERESGDKQTRADPFASQWNASDGQETWTVALVRGEWNEWYLGAMLAFPNGRYDDPVDASSGAFNRLASYRVAPPAVGPQRYVAVDPASGSYPLHDMPNRGYRPYG
jgi:predicted phage terminase large subunit-like protein